MVRMGSPVRFRRGAPHKADQRKRRCFAVPGPFVPATSVAEWDPKGPLAVRAPIALLSSNIGRGGSGTARIGPVA